MNCLLLALGPRNILETLTYCALSGKIPPSLLRVSSCGFLLLSPTLHEQLKQAHA